MKRNCRLSDCPDLAGLERTVNRKERKEEIIRSKALSDIHSVLMGSTWITYKNKNLRLHI